MVPAGRRDSRDMRRVLRAGQDRLEQMKVVVAMVVASLASVLVVGALVDPRARLEVLLGMLGPLLMASGSWVLTERTFRDRPQALTSVMIAAFAFKVLFFGAYVAVMIRVVALRPVPFIASFTGYLAGLYLMDALYLRHLFRQKLFR